MIATANRNPDSLDLEAALANVNFIKDKHDGIIDGPVDEVVERLLDQLVACGREAYPGEDMHLRRAILCYADGGFHGAMSSTISAAHAGSALAPAMHLGLFDIDDSISLRQALEQARATRSA